MRVGYFWEVIAFACDRWRGSVTSGHRTQARNATVGGAPNSQHLGDKAADIAWDNPTDRAPAEDFLRSRGFWIEPPRDAPDHTHVDDRNDAPLKYGREKEAPR